MEEAAASSWQSALFNPGELIAYKAEAHFRPTSDSSSQFFCINPISSYRGGTTSANVSAHRNLLFEMDIGTRQTQERFLEERERVPYALKTFSGGKSLHYIVALTEDVGASKYSEYWQFIKYLYKDKVDLSCSDPNQLSRTPNAVRSVNGKKQKLLDVRGRISVEAFEQWLYGGPHAGKYYLYKAIELPKREAWLAQQQQLAANNPGVMPEWVAVMDGRRVSMGQRHAKLMAAAIAMAKAQVDRTLAEERIEQLALDMEKDTSEAFRILGWAYAQRFIG